MQAFMSKDKILQYVKENMSSTVFYTFAVIGSFFLCVSALKIA